MVELNCIAELFWAGGALRTGAPGGSVFLPNLRDWLWLAGRALPDRHGDGPARLPITGDVRCV